MPDQSLLRIGGSILVGIPTITWPFKRLPRFHSSGSETIVATDRYMGVGYWLEAKFEDYSK